MRNFTSLCFSKDGIVNPQAADFYRANELKRLVIVSDGSEESYNHIVNYDFSELIDDTTDLMVARTPLWDMRILSRDGELSRPHYVFEDAKKIDWFCRTICIPVVQIYVSDTTSSSSTEFEMTGDMIAATCKTALTLWDMYTVLENHLSFPALAIDGLVSNSRLLRDPNLTSEILRNETGLKTLEFNAATDTLSITVGNESFLVKRSVIAGLLTEQILPFFNKNKGRRYRLNVSIAGISGSEQNFEIMTYGQLGRYLSLLRPLIIEQKISSSHPIDNDDLFAYGKNLVVHPETCMNRNTDQTLGAFLSSAKDVWIRGDDTIRPVGNPAQSDTAVSVPA